MSRKEESVENIAHPNHMDRNRSIIWARYHMDSEDWVMLAVKATRRADASGKNAISLVTVALTDNKGKTILECMCKASDMVSHEEVSQHGVDYSVVYNAISYEDVRNQLVKKIGEKSIVAWDLEALQNIFAELDAANKLPPCSWKGHSTCKELARFVGRTKGDGYELQPLPALGLGAIDQCRSVYRVIAEMASSSQVTDQAAAGKPGWTAEFYKPKETTKEKVKGFFGL